MSTAQAKAGATVHVTDDLTEATEAAHERIAAVQAHGHATFIDSLTDAEWASWDASDELAIVADSGGIDAVDPIDVLDDECLRVAA